MKTYRSLSGVTVRRVFGNKKQSYKLDLEFKNIADSGGELTTGAGTALAIIEHYNEALGTFDEFNLPNAVFNGMNNDLRDPIKSPYTNLKWRYAEPPKVTSVFRGLSTVSVSLIGEISI